MRPHDMGSFTRRLKQGVEMNMLTRSLIDYQCAANAALLERGAESLGERGGLLTNAELVLLERYCRRNKSPEWAASAIIDGREHALLAKQENAERWPGGMGAQGDPLLNRTNDAAASARVDSIKRAWLPGGAL